VECFATCVLILIGEATIANYKFALQSSNSTLPVAIAFGVATYSGNIDRNENKISIDHFRDSNKVYFLFENDSSMFDQYPSLPSSITSLNYSDESIRWANPILLVEY
jgi:hypothetical protein